MGRGRQVGWEGGRIGRWDGGKVGRWEEVEELVVR